MQVSYSHYESLMFVLLVVVFLFPPASAFLLISKLILKHILPRSALHTDGARLIKLDFIASGRQWYQENISGGVKRTSSFRKHGIKSKSSGSKQNRKFESKRPMWVDSINAATITRRLEHPHRDRDQIWHLARICASGAIRREVAEKWPMVQSLINAMGDASGKLNLRY